MVCMYVCMYRGRPSWRCPWDRAFQLGQGEGPIGIMGPISQPRGIIDTASLTLNHTCVLMYAFWVIQAAKVDLFPHEQRGRCDRSRFRRGGPDSQLQLYVHVWVRHRDEQGNEVMLKDSQKIVVPRGAQDEILKELHRSHSGILKTYTTAAQLYYWPGMKNSINQMIESHGSCRETDQASREQQFTYIHLQKLSHP